MSSLSQDQLEFSTVDSEAQILKDGIFRTLSGFHEYWVMAWDGDRVNFMDDDARQSFPAQLLKSYEALNEAFKKLLQLLKLNCTRAWPQQQLRQDVMQLVFQIAPLIDVISEFVADIYDKVLKSQILVSAQSVEELEFDCAEPVKQVDTALKAMSTVTDSTKKMLKIFDQNKE